MKTIVKITAEYIRLFFPHIEKMNVCGIYEIGGPKGKIYIGSSFSIRGRLYMHLRRLFLGKHDNKKLQSSWDKYGSHRFRIRILEVCAKSRLSEVEQKWINKTECWKHGYNIQLAVGSNLGLRQSAKTLAKRSKAMMGQQCALGARHSLAQRRRKAKQMSELPVPRSRIVAATKTIKAYNDKIRNGAIIHPMKGKKFSPAAKENMRRAAKRRFSRPSERRKHSERIKKAHRRGAYASAYKNRDNARIAKRRVISQTFGKEDYTVLKSLGLV